MSYTLCIDLFESKLEEFCSSKNVTQAEFLKRCRGASCEDDKSKLYMNILLSSVEYETFVKLMYIMKPVAERKLQAEAEAKNMDERYEADGDAKSGAKAMAKGESNDADGDADMKEMEDLHVSDNADAKSSNRYDTDDEDVKSGSK